MVRAGAEPAGGAGGSPRQPLSSRSTPSAGAAPSLRSSLPPGPQVVNSWPLGGSGQGWLDLRCPPGAPAPAPPIPSALPHTSARDALGLRGPGLLGHPVDSEQLSVRRLGGWSRPQRLPLKPRAWWRSPIQASVGAGPLALGEHALLLPHQGVLQVCGGDGCVSCRGLRKSATDPLVRRRSSSSSNEPTRQPHLATPLPTPKAPSSRQSLSGGCWKPCPGMSW